MRNVEAPKIVQIETRYVETDATNFRDVVQSLTGKNSSTAWIGRSNHSNADAASSSSSMGKSGNSQVSGGTASTTTTTTKPQEEGGVAVAATTSYSKEDCVVPNSMLTNNMSFKDFDLLLLELPSGDMEGFLPWLSSTNI